MKNIFFLAIFCLFITSCWDKTTQNANEVKETEIKKSNITKLRGCIFERDTVINQFNSIMYVIIDSFYTVKLKVGGVDTVLPYKFNCTVPRGLVPRFYSYRNNKICLLRGFSNDFREFVIAYTDKNGIVTVKEYEVALTSDLENDLVVYQNYDSLQLVNVENIRTAQKIVFKIPLRFSTKNISNANIMNEILTVEFFDKKKIKFSLKEGNK